MKQNCYGLDKMAKSILGDVRHLQIPVWMILCCQIQALIFRTYEGFCIESWKSVARTVTVSI
jgi:hypothetical protein